MRGGDAGNGSDGAGNGSDTGGGGDDTDGGSNDTSGWSDAGGNSGGCLFFPAHPFYFLFPRSFVPVITPPVSPIFHPRPFFVFCADFFLTHGVNWSTLKALTTARLCIQ